MQIITTDALKSTMTAETAPFLLDVREPAENAEYNIGGVLLPLGKIQSMMIEDIEHLKDQEIVCYCRSGQRSMQACMLLESMGFRNVKNLAGGMLEWREKFDQS